MTTEKFYHYIGKDQTEFIMSQPLSKLEEMKAIFSTFDGAKKLFEEVVKPSTIKSNNQINLF